MLAHVGRTSIIAIGEFILLVLAGSQYLGHVTKTRLKADSEASDNFSTDPL